MEAFLIFISPDMYFGGVVILARHRFTARGFNRSQKEFELIQPIDPIVIYGVAIRGQFALFIPIAKRKSAYPQVFCSIFDSQIFSLHTS